MALLADNLLDMAKLQTGGIRLRKDWQSLEELVGAALRMLEQPLRDHPLRLRSTRNCRCSTAMRADRAGAGQSVGKRHQIHAGGHRYRRYGLG
jgi:signal transduction histidine kinase